MDLNRECRDIAHWFRCPENIEGLKRIFQLGLVKIGQLGNQLLECQFNYNMSPFSIKISHTTRNKQTILKLKRQLRLAVHYKNYMLG